MLGAGVGTRRVGGGRCSGCRRGRHRRRAGRRRRPRPPRALHLDLVGLAAGRRRVVGVPPALDRVDERRSRRGRGPTRRCGRRASRCRASAQVVHVGLHDRDQQHDDGDPDAAPDPPRLRAAGATRRARSRFRSSRCSRRRRRRRLRWVRRLRIGRGRRRAGTVRTAGSVSSFDLRGGRRGTVLVRERVLRPYGLAVGHLILRFGDARVESVDARSARVLPDASGDVQRARRCV